MTAWLMHGAGMARAQNAQTFTGQPLALQEDEGGEEEEGDNGGGISHLAKVTSLQTIFPDHP